MTANERKLAQLGSSQIAKLTIEYLLLEQLALKAAAANAAARNSGYTPLFKLHNVAVSLTDERIVSVPAAGANVEFNTDGGYPTYMVENASNLPSYFYFADQLYATDNLVIEAELYVTNVSGLNKRLVGLGIASRINEALAVEAYNDLPEDGNAYLRIKKGSTIVSTIEPVEAGGENDRIKIRLEKSGSTIKFSQHLSGALNSSIVFDQANMYGPATNDSSNNDVSQAVPALGWPCLILNGCTCRIISWEVWTKTPADSKLMLVGDENLQGYRVPYSKTTAALLGDALTVSQASSYGMASSLLTHYNADFFKLQPKAVLLWVGLNDIIASPNNFLGTFENNYRAMIRKLSRFNIWPIRVLLPPCSVVTNQKIKELNDRILFFMDSYPVLNLWDSELSTNPDSLAANTPNPKYFDADLWHLNAAGHEYVANKILNELPDWGLDRVLVPELGD